MTETDLELAQQHVDENPHAVVPWNGELLDLRDVPQVARALGEIREWKRRLDEFRGLLETILRIESQRQGTKTLHLDNGLTCTVTGGTRVSYDTEALLEGLAAAGLPADRLSEAVKMVVEYKPNGRVLKQLEAASPAYAEVIHRARRVEEIAWRVSVT